MDIVAVARSLADDLPVNELNDVQLSELLAQAKLRGFERDEVIYHRGDRARDLLYRAFEMFEARVEKLTQALEDVMLLDVPSRLAKYLLDSGSGQPAPHALTLTQDELAAAVGSTRVTVNKVLADFEHRGLIRVARRHVDVLAPDKLRKEIHG